MAKHGGQDRSRELSRLFGTSVVPVEAPERVASRRERVVAKLSRSIVEAAARRRTERRFRVSGAVVAAAACLLLAVGVASRVHERTASPAVTTVASRTHVRAVSGLVSVERNATRAALSADGERLLSGDRIATSASASAVVELENEVFLELKGQTSVALLSSRAHPYRFRMDGGRIEAHVDPRPAPSPKLVIETPGVEVVVTGTVFGVQVVPAASGLSPETVVTVTEGRVVIRRDGQSVAVVTAGQRWSSTEARDVETNEAPPTPVSASAPPPAEPAAPEKPKASATRRSTATGSLAEENLLFRAAVDARNRGDDELALYRYDELLTKYPKSPLAHEASVEKLRALRRLGRTRDASEQASRYIADHPEGAASDEARALLLQPKR